MKISRRHLFALGLGGVQLGLLAKMGMLGTARAAASGPTKLLTIYVPGGWLPQLIFPSMNDAQIAKQISSLGDTSAQEPLFYKPGQVVAPSKGGAYDPGPRETKQPFRVAQLWKPGAGDANEPGFNPNGYAWVKNKLWENTCVLHGIDQGTADHLGGQVAAMSGAAGAEFRCPSMHAVVANAMYAKYKDARPIGSVAVRSLLYPNPYGLPNGGPTIMSSMDSLKETLTERNQLTWKGMSARNKKTIPGFDGKSPTDVTVNPIDEYVLKETAALRGKSSAGADSYLETLYRRLASTSVLLGKDVVTLLEKTPGLKEVTDYAVGLGGGGYRTDAGGSWGTQFDLALRLLRSNLTTSVAIDTHGPGLFNYDTHGQTFESHARNLRQTHEVIGRFLGEMKTSPGVEGGASLLDETLVVIMSEFGRGPSDNNHWPTNSFVLAGGGINTDLMLGNYDVEGKPEKHPALGLPVDIKEEDARLTKRLPKAADVCATVYHCMGIEQFFIPGGYGEILGVKKS
jgi:Protein of unknown function (DUF1501)